MFDFFAVLPTDIIKGAGVLCINSDTPFGGSDGGLSFDPGVEWANRDFDGKTCDVEGQDYITGFKSTISGTLFRMNQTATAMYEPGSTTATVSGVDTVTPHVAAVELTASTHYLTNVRLIFPRTGGGYVWVRFPKALFKKYAVKGANKNDGKVDVTIAAVLATTAALNACPYVIEYAAALS